MATEIDETFKRIQSHKGVMGIIVLNTDGIPIKSTMDNNSTIEYAGLITHLLDKARQTVKELDNTNELTFLRVRSKKNEILIAPDKEYMMIVVQNPNESSVDRDNDVKKDTAVNSKDDIIDNLGRTLTSRSV
ncbi:Dynein light chain roadblock-type 2 like protein [Argiope bruennichi]|uniref:Dynein light chain roadblock-type 2 like protein n=2 Tax=Araneidae TaxID=6913 RepID=A0A8T0EYF3_ARGBR|nr:Dynein light chain roadblock-type 2 like protein [Argiope bruennichi]